MSTAPEQNTTPSSKAGEPFVQLGVSSDLAALLPARGIHTPSPIQRAAMPIIARGRDVIGCANTGSGKTAAYLLPIIGRWITGPPGAPQLLVLADTWDLVRQIAEEAESFGGERGIRAVTLYGGNPAQTQREQLAQGAHIAVGSIGRVRNFLADGTLDAAPISTLIIDEADRLIRGTENWDTMTEIATRCSARRQTLAFSATVDSRTISRLRPIMRNPEIIDVSERVVTDRISYTAYQVNSEYDKVALLLGLLRSHQIEKAIIFLRTNNDVLKLHDTLVRNGITDSRPFCKLVGSRERNFDEFKNGQVRLLVASGLAERGLDIPGITHIFHFDFPDDQGTFIQRSGRTDRMNYTHQSVVVSFITRRDESRMRMRNLFPSFPFHFDRPLPPPIPRMFVQATDNEWKRR